MPLRNKRVINPSKRYTTTQRALTAAYVPPANTIYKSYNKKGRVINKYTIYNFGYVLKVFGYPAPP